MNRTRSLPLLFAAATLATACSAQTDNGSSADTASQTPVVALTSIDQFAAAFDTDKGAPRLILPISPT